MVVSIAGEEGKAFRATLEDYESGCISRRLRIGMPILVPANVAFLLLANFCRGSATLIDGHAPFGTLKPHTATDDNLFSALAKLYGAGAWLSVFIVGFLSGALPYLKLFGTAGVVALADMGYIKKESGIEQLQWLEAMGKYGFADVCLIGFNAILFNISTGGSYAILLVGSLSIEIWMHLKFGVVALLIGVMFSQIITHWAVFDLKSDPLIGGHVLDDGDAEIEPLLNNSLQQRERRPVIDRFFYLNAGEVVMAGTGTVAFLCGVATPMITIEQHGFIGNLIRPKEDRTLDISAVSMGTGMMKIAKDRDEHVLAFISVVFVIFSIVLPVLEFLSLFFSGVFGLARKRRWGGYTRLSAGIFHSFGWAETLIVCCIAIRLEISTMINYNIGEECKPFTQIMSNKPLLTVAGLGFAASDSCFKTNTELQSGWWFLFSALVLRFFAWRCEAYVLRLTP